MGAGSRYFGGAVAFGFAAMWIMASLAAALVCLAAAAVGYSSVLLAEKTRAKLANRAGRASISASAASAARPIRRPEVADLRVSADALNTDLGHVYEPAATTPSLPAEAPYGWPANDEASVSGDALH
jgi:hypothetical protein